MSSANMGIRLHHMEFLCNNLQRGLRQFCGQFGFRPFAVGLRPNRVALQRNAIYLVLTEGTTSARNTVSNIALEVKDVDQVTARVKSYGGKIINHPRTLEDCSGKVSSSMIQSPLGNVVHTLLNTEEYDGLFLPGFDNLTSKLLHTNSNVQANEDLFTHLDHVAFACPQGSSLEIMEWYNKCLGFTRFCLNSEEKEDGFTIQSSVNYATVGMKLAAMEYWKCSEVGLQSPPDDLGSGTKFVLAEALPGQGPNQIQTFLNEHGGPGVQHIGLHTADMVQAVHKWKKAGVEFIKPPETYYTQPDKIQEILHAGHSVKNLKDHDILLDEESFKSSDISDKDRKETLYLMQVFTKPIFDENTFFMEIIQRCGATGFGAGNITALWRALDENLKVSTKNIITGNTL